jgi:hypothetical protein
MTDKQTDVSVLFEGMDVSDELIEKFQTNLEATISEKVSAYKAEIDAENEKAISEAVETQIADITDKIDDYLSYVVESWAEENRLALESGIKLEIMESFVDGMKDLFVEHYVDVPEGKDDIVTVAEEKVSTLQDDLNEEIQKNIALKKELESIKRSGIVSESSKGLTETQKEKFNALLEDIDSSDSEVFAKKVKTIRESFFKSENANADNSDDGKSLNEDKAVSPMSRYLNAL